MAAQKSLIFVIIYQANNFTTQKRPVHRITIRMPVVLLIDNGSVRAAATLQLRYIAKCLSEKTSQKIHPVSFKHANKIPQDLLNGEPASIFYSFMSQQLSQGESEFIVLPLFFGESKALTSLIPDEIESLKQSFGDFTISISELIYPLPTGEGLLCDILYDLITDTANIQGVTFDNIVVVDHGSPVPRVTNVRKHLVKNLHKRFPADIKIEQAVMERRPGKQYDFNGNLLEYWLDQKALSGETSAIVSLLFFLPGRHAGDEGDIVEICQSIMNQYPGFKVCICPLISEHPLLISILEQRLIQQLIDYQPNIPI